MAQVFHTLLTLSLLLIPIVAGASVRRARGLAANVLKLVVYRYFIRILVSVKPLMYCQVLVYPLMVHSSSSNEFPMNLCLV